MPQGFLEPTTRKPSELAKYFADKIDPPTGEGGRVRGFIAGALEGAGDEISSMTSPLGIGSAALPWLRLGRLGSLMRRGTKATPAKTSVNVPDVELPPDLWPVGGEAPFNAMRANRAQEMLDRSRAMSQASRPRNSVDPALTVPKNEDLVNFMQNMTRTQAARPRGGEKIAVIEDLMPKWQGYGPEDYFNFMVDVGGKPSHGMLTPEEKTKLLQEGYRFVKRSEM